jgi:ADP-heptose:LPS heptosyltransferase
VNVCANPLPQPPAADRILVIRLGAVGDVVRTLPAASALRGAFPGSHLAWLVEPASASAVAGQPWIDEVICFPRGEIDAALAHGRLVAAVRALLGCVRALRRRRFELALDFHSIAKSALLARASGAPRRAAYAPPHGREASWWLANARARLAPRRLPRFARNRGLVEFLGVPSAPRGAPLHVAGAARRHIGEALGAAAAPVVLHPGTSAATPHKRWPVERYAALARALAGEGVPSIVSFGPTIGERALAEELVAAAGGAARLAPETATLGELAALFERCRLFVGSDSGPLHVASLVGTPVVQLLGPTDPIENEPYPTTPARTVRVPVACSPCRRGCAAATCMRRIELGDVLEAARALLATPPGGW